MYKMSASNVEKVCFFVISIKFRSLSFEHLDASTPIYQNFQILISKLDKSPKVTNMYKFVKVPKKST